MPNQMRPAPTSRVAAAMMPRIATGHGKAVGDKTGDGGLQQQDDRCHQQQRAGADQRG